MGVSKHRPEMATTTSDHDRRPDKFGLSSLSALSNVESFSYDNLFIELKSKAHPCLTYSN